MPDKKKTVLPLAAAIALVLLLWLAFHDRTADSPVASPVVKTSP